MNLENQMHLLWRKYLETKDFKYLAEASEKTPFFCLKEISEILRNLK